MKRTTATRMLSLLLCCAMLLGNFPAASYAAYEDGRCEHHPEHTEECGYAEDSPCTYECEICAAKVVNEAAEATKAAEETETTEATEQEFTEEEPTEEEPTKEEPTEEEPAEGESTEEEPTEEEPTEEEPAEGESTEEEPTEGESTEEEPTEEEPAEEEPTEGEPAEEEPTEEEPTEEEPTEEEPAEEEPTEEEPTEEEPTEEEPAEEKPTEEQPTDEEPTEEGLDEDDEVITITEYVEFDAGELSGGTPSVEFRIMSFLYMPQDRNEETVRNSSTQAASKLSGASFEIYRACLPLVTDVAYGRRASTSFDLNLPSITTHYTAAQLGVSSIKDSSGNLRSDVKTALYAALNLDAGKIDNALRRDCPYEMYWADLSSNANWGISFTSTEVWLSGNVNFTLCAVADYSKTGSRSQTVDTTKTAATANTRTTARNIVAKYAGNSNLSKLQGYANELCYLTEYNFPAVDSPYPGGYGNPWQIIYMFDGNPNTKVVCEGYAKSFQYLCELSSFSGNVYTICAVGNMLYSDGGGAHMWNIVHMDDGRNYLVDVTNSDGGSSCNNRYFFTLPSSGSVQYGYVIDGTRFVYNEYSTTLFNTSDLTLSTVGYTSAPRITSNPSGQSTLAGKTVCFSVSASGSNLRYQWQYKAPGSSSWKNCGSTFSGSTTSTLYVNAAASYNNYQFRCAVSDSTPAKRTVYSSSATLKVSSLKINSHPQSVCVMAEKTATFTVSASGTGLTYQWEYLPAGSTAWFKVGGGTKSSLAITAATSLNGYQFRCVVSDSEGNKVTSSSATLRVCDLKITAQPKSVTAFSGKTVTFSVTATSSSTLKYQWQYKTPSSTSWSNSPATGNTTSTLSVPSNGRNGYQYRCVVSDGCGKSVTSKAATLKVCDLKITAQPKSVTAFPGKTVTFSVSATSSSTIKYQWQYKTPSSTSWSNSPATGNTTRTLTVPSDGRNGYQYRCIVSDGCGKSVASNAATLKVCDLKITAQPKSVTAFSGKTVTFSVTATSSSTLKYQWQYKTPSGTSWSNSPAAGNTTRTLTVPVDGRNGNQYRCVVSDSCGFSVASSAATLKVCDLKITAQPKSVTAFSGKTVTFSVSATSSSTLKYQWQYKTPGGTSWSNSPAAGNTSRTLTVPVDGRNGNQYRCIVSDGCGKSVTSNAATLKVCDLKITAQPKSVTAFSGKTVTFSVSATSSSTLKYRWQYKTPSSTGWSNSPAAGNTTRTLTVPVDGRNGYQYRCIVSDGCGKSVTSNTATLKVCDLKITVQPRSVTSAPGMTVTFSVTASSSSSIKYQWQYKTPSGTSWSNSPATGNTTRILSVPADGRNGYQYRCIVSDSCGTRFISGAATLTVKTMKITQQPKSQTAGVGQTVSFTVEATGVGLSYQWEYLPSGSTTWSKSTATGCHTATLQLTATTGRKGMSYRCVITDISGKKLITNAAKLTVI